MTMPAHFESPGRTLDETMPKPRGAAWTKRLFELLMAFHTSQARALLLAHGHALDPPPGDKRN